MKTNSEWEKKLRKEFFANFTHVVGDDNYGFVRWLPDNGHKDSPNPHKAFNWFLSKLSEQRAEVEREHKKKLAHISVMYLEQLSSMAKFFGQSDSRFQSLIAEILSNLSEGGEK